MESQPHKPRARGVVALIVVVIVFAVLYLGGLALYLTDSGADTADLKAGTVPADHLQLHVDVSVVDPVKQSFDVIIEPQPTGTLTADNGFTAKKDFTFYITTGDIAKTITVKAGEPMTAMTIPVPLDGEISVYPFDSYAGSVQLSSDLPIQIDAVSHIQAYHAGMVLDDKADPTNLNVNFTFTRSLSIVLFALFIYTLMALVAMVVVVVTVCVVWGDYGMDFGHLTWGAALLFVLPGVRSGLPGQPPIGTLADFLVFFWAEVLVVACTVVLVFTWVTRAKPKP